MCFKMAPFPLCLLEEQGGLSSDIYDGNLVKFLEVHFIKPCRPPYESVPLQFVIPSCPHRAPSDSSITVKAFLLSTCSRGGSHLWSWVMEAVILSVSLIFEASCCLRPPLSYRSQKSCGFFSQVSFLLFRVEQWLLSSLHVELDFILSICLHDFLLTCDLHFYFQQYHQQNVSFHF